MRDSSVVCLFGGGLMSNSDVRSSESANTLSSTYVRRRNAARGPVGSLQTKPIQLPSAYSTYHKPTRCSLSSASMPTAFSALNDEKLMKQISRDIGPSDAGKVAEEMREVDAPEHGLDDADLF